MNRREELAERRRAYARQNRTIKMAITYLRKAYWGLHADGGPQAGYWDLLDATLTSAQDIVEALPDEFFATTKATSFLDGKPFDYNSSDTAFEAAQKLVATLEARRRKAGRLDLIAKLEATAGRSPEEAALYAAKAQELRARA